MSAWEEMTERERAYHQQVEAIAIRTGVEPISDFTPVDAVAAMEAAGAVDAMFREMLREQLEEGMTEEEALECALREIKTKAAANGWRAFARHVFRDGWDPATVMRRLYAVVIETAPELCPMKIAELATLLGETRSATDGRQMKMFRDTAVRGRHRKRSQSVERMRQSATGNSNRRNGEKKRRVLAIGEKGKG